MKRIFPFTFIILIIILATGCTTTADTVDTPLYSGQSLSLAVIGEVPKVREEHIKFINISFDELEDYTKLSSVYDAVFIMKEHLSEAAQGKYAKVYKNAGIPFFYIESTKSFMPFVAEELSYDDISDTGSGMYATGYLASDKGDRSWGYGLYNNIVNAPNIKSAYSRMFTTIDSVKNGMYK